MRASSQQARVTVKPVRPYRRFQNSKVANTGIDPIGNYKHFITKDPTSNLDVHRDRKRLTRFEDHVRLPTGKVPYGTTKCTFNLGLGTDGKLLRNTLGFSTQTFPRNPTDNISSEPPAFDRPFQNLYDKMVSTAKYEKNVRTTNPWAPRRVTA